MVYIVLYTLFKLIFLFAIRIIVLLCVNSDVVSAELFKCNSQISRYVRHEQNKIYHSIFTFVVIIMFIVYPFVQLIIVLFGYGIFIEQNILSIINTMNLIETVQIVAENADIVYILEKRKIKLSDVYEIAWKKEFLFNLLIVFLFNVKSSKQLNVVHCFFVYYMCMFLTQTTSFVTALSKLSFNRKAFINDNIFSRIIAFEKNVWKMNRILQALILAKLIFIKQYGVFELIYIFLIPIIIMNQE
jgi:hypothetical protein